MLKNRRSRLDQFFESNMLDAILVTDLRNIRFLCGFSGSDAALLVSSSTAWFLCDSRYTAQAGEEVKDTVIKETSSRSDSIAALAAEMGLRRIAVESGHMSLADFRKLQTTLPNCDLVEIGPDFDEIRACKDDFETQQLRQVAELSSRALSTVLTLIKPGIRELDVARELEFEMRRLGADGRAFDFIVASGIRGAMPHGRASDKQIQSGELVTIDFGAVKNGYHSDETVTVACGEPGARECRIHEVVRVAHDLAIEKVKPGITCRELDAVARDYISAQGYGEYFGHGLGHGVGLDIHERPTVSPRSDAVLDVGMVITVEPGIYIPGFGGVRIEDTVVVTNNGGQVITCADKQLLRM